MDSREGALRGLHILVVEDDRDAREILKSVLSYFGAVVTATPSPKEGLRLLREVRPDLVVADMLLGTSDGIALLRQARKDRSLAPFIAVSGADFELHKLKDVGFSAYLRKPLDHEKLVDAILAALPGRKAS